ncbi:late competence protein ComER [Marinicrinis sediminis]|uniref:Pyrroline-5-carboxylate reductase n=1 Tax=Marinicrinis sediminis TaxID=1652465 RepID=A0ABW5R9G3_9BACL
MKIGFIGTGSMGTILVQSLIKSGACHPNQILIFNRTRKKAERLQEQYPDILIPRTAQELASQADVIFLCIKPLEYKNVIDEIVSCTRSEQIVISITSPVWIEHLEDQLPCKIVKVIPSITNYARSGASLCMFSQRLTEEDRLQVFSLLSAISEPLEINENYTRISSDLSSCGPAFLAFFVQQLIQAAVDHTGISREEATRLASEMVLGTGKLLTSEGFTPDTLIEKVSVPGGITAEAIRFMDHRLEGMFDQLIMKTHAKYDEDVEKVEAMIYGTKVD